MQIVGGQIRNVTLSQQGIGLFDYFEPSFNSGNITRIVGGKPVNISQVPWQVALYRYDNFICGGSIISVDWVLTAAHCVEDRGYFVVRAGSSYMNQNGRIHLASLVVVNSKFNSQTANFDIAMIRVRPKFQITRYVKPVRLARDGLALPNRLFVSGWGSLRQDGPPPAELRGVTLHRFPRRQCRAKYSGIGIDISEYMICVFTPNKDACQGDSGGPLVHGKIQYGIVSFGIECADPNYPGVYTNIRALNSWIKNVVERWGGQEPIFV